MKRATLIFYSALLLSMLSCAPGNEHRIGESVASLLQRYPDATLQDVYKSFFQDYFGVAHLLAEREKVKSYIEYETNSATEFDSTLYEPCGWRGNFVRVNLLAIKKGYIDSNALTDAFIKSREASCDSVTGEWLDEWQQIMEATRRAAPAMENFERDSALIAKNLAEGKYMMHHSRQYNEYYHPHYRIIHKDVFEQEILPLLPR